jgi:pyridoxal 5-phosphate dependent beta-lyase
VTTVQPRRGDIPTRPGDVPAPARWDLPGADVAAAWRAARSHGLPGHLDAARCNLPSDRVLEAQIAHLHRERELGGYGAEAAVAGQLDAARAGLAALVGARTGDVAFLENGTVAMVAVLAGWRLPAGARIGVLRTEFGSNLMMLRRLAVQRGWNLVALPVDAVGRLDLDGLRAALDNGLDLVTFPHIASQRGVLQPAQAAGGLCRAAGVPVLLDVCQSLGHADVTGTRAAAYVGTSRKWLAGPRGVGFVIVPGLRDGDERDAFAPSIQSHQWSPTRSDGSVPVPSAARYETSEAPIAGRLGLAVAVAEHHALGPDQVQERLAAIGAATRHLLHDLGGWQAVEPLDEPTAIVTLRPPPTRDPSRTVDEAVARARSEGVLVCAIPGSRAPDDMPTPVLRVSPSVGADPEDLLTLAGVLGA